MAKKDQRINVVLECTVCKTQGYITKRNKINTPEKLKMKKFCRRCQKHTDHKETSRLK